MTFKQLIQLLPKVVRYNLKIIFAGKFFWFLLAAFGFFALFMFQNAVIDDLCGNFCYSDYLFIHSHFIAVSGQSA